VLKCVIFDVRSIFEVQVVNENFSLYMVLVHGTKNFSRSAKLAFFVIFQAILLAQRNRDLGNNMHR